MKKKIIISMFILGFALCAFAQEEKKVSVGLGLEWNMNPEITLQAAPVLDFTTI